MKFSIAASILLSVPAVIAFTPKNFNNKASLNNPSPSALRYADPSAQDAGAWGSEQATNHDPFTAALAESLEISDDDVRFEYAEWLMRNNKAPDETRYPAFKKNILIQAQHNREHGQYESLNEYGDITGGTCRTWGVCLLLVSFMR
jgi:hypothetical protein